MIILMGINYSGFIKRLFKTKFTLQLTNILFSMSYAKQIYTFELVAEFKSFTYVALELEPKIEGTNETINAG